MNTPRTKKPKRYIKKPFVGLTGGHESGINNPAIAPLVGSFLTLWPHIEEEMIPLFAEILEINDSSSARILFRNIINANIRFGMMRALLENTPQHAEKSDWFDRQIDEHAALNKIRNNYAHGLWWTHQDTMKVFLENDTDSYEPYRERIEVTFESASDVFNRATEHLKQFSERRRLLAALKRPKS